MANFSWLKDFTAQAKTKVKQFNNANFKNGTMAVCALVAAADGSVDDSERKKVAKLIGGNELLSVFDGSELRDLFLGYCDKASDDFARLDLLSLVGKLKSNPDQAETAVKIALIIANADGNFDNDEKAVVKEICVKLGLKYADYVD